MVQLHDDLVYDSITGTFYTPNNLVQMQVKNKGEDDVEEKKKDDTKEKKDTEEKKKDVYEVINTTNNDMSVNEIMIPRDPNAPPARFV